ncbi:Uncharacterised protein [uncultured Flavonifractor sp.]|nr:Uncharacterised protein [uncultured Flavonifractor sp.]
MKKFTGSFTPDASKALKGSQRLICRTDKDGVAYVTNGFTAYKMFPHEYAAIVQPVTCCEAGNYSIQNGEKRDEVDFNLEKTFLDSVKAANDTGDMARCPLVLTLDKKRTAAAYYNAEKDFVALYDTRYISALSSGFTLRAPGPTAPAVAYNDNDPFALILPIRPDENTTRAVKAYFTQAAANKTDEASEAEQLRAEISRLQDKLNRAETGAAALEERVEEQAAELEALRTAAGHNDTADESKPATNAKSAAEIIAQRFASMDGVTATIKGAQTAAPVVWLSGDTEKHADEIKAAGAKWSGKKSAYYVRVA